MLYIALYSAKIAIYRQQNKYGTIFNTNDIMRKFDIKRLRVDKGLKQSEMAELLNIPQSSISSMENGKTQVSQNYINILVEKLAIDNIDEYYYDVEEMVSINNENNTGHNNGYKNTFSQTGAVADPLILTKLAVIERDLVEYNEANRKLENKRDELEAEVKKLRDQQTEFIIRCVQNGIDISDILAKK